MEKVIIFIAGLLIGYSYWGVSIDSSSVYLYGGFMSSSKVGIIYGYVDDFESCNIHAKAMNYYFKSDEETQKKILSSKGNSFCSRE